MQEKQIRFFTTILKNFTIIYSFLLSEKEKLKTEYFGVGDLEVSYNDKLLGYSLDLKGSEYFTIYIRDISSGKLVTEKIEETSGSITFSLDDKTLEVVKDFAEKLTKKKISLVNAVDENIIGGFNLKIGDKMIDCTVSNKLNELRKKLINN